MNELRQLQLLSIDMLRQFDEICNRHSIEYFIIFGTALGAVRHQGFIPWDDDIDLGMTRTEYRKLKALPKEAWGEELYLADGESDLPYHEKVFPRVYKKGTDFESAFWVKYVSNPEKGIGVKPISIDIMLYDHVNSVEEARRIMRKARRLNKMLFYSRYKINFVSEDSLAMKIRTLSKRMIHLFLKTFRKPEDLYQKYVRLVSRTEGEYMISYDTWTTNDIMGSLMKTTDMFPLQTVEFDGIRVKALRCMDQYLTQVYGDYMKLPPEDQQVGHLPMILDLGGYTVPEESNVHGS